MSASPQQVSSLERWLDVIAELHGSAWAAYPLACSPIHGLRKPFTDVRFWGCCMVKADRLMRWQVGAGGLGMALVLAVVGLSAWRTGDAVTTTHPRVGARAGAVLAIVEELAAKHAGLAHRLSSSRNATPFVRKDEVVQSLPLPPGFGRGVTSRVPQTGDLPLEMGGLRLVAVGAKSVRADVAQGRVVYQDQYEDTDSVVVQGQDWVEVLWLLRSPKAPRRFEYEMRLPEGAEVRDNASGGLEVVKGEEVLARMPRPEAVDAAGRPVEVAMGWAAGRLSVEAQLDADLTWPVLVDPVVEVPGWNSMVPFRNRSAHAMATLGTKVVLFGGWDGGPLSDTWEWDGATWTQRTPSTSPPARFQHAMATLGTKVVLFGGNGGNGRLSDTWEWDGTSWTQRTPTTSPPTRVQHAMATLGTKVVLFGGYGDSGFLSDTWEWDGANWTQRAPLTSPPARWQHAIEPAPVWWTPSM